MTLASKALTAPSVSARPKLTHWADLGMKKAVFALDVELAIILLVVARVSVVTTVNVAKARLFYFK